MGLAMVARVTAELRAATARPERFWDSSGSEAAPELLLARWARPASAWARDERPLGALPKGASTLEAASIAIAVWRMRCVGRGKSAPGPKPEVARSGP